MLKKLPAGFRVPVLFLLSLSTVFIVFSLSIVFFNFPFSIEQVSSFFARNIGNRSIDSEDSPFGNLDRYEYGHIVDFDPDSISDISVDLFRKKVTFESLIPGYEVNFIDDGLISYTIYSANKGFWEDNMVTRTYTSEELTKKLAEEKESFTPGFITAESLTIQLLPYSGSARFFSGSEVDMSLDYEASGSEVVIQIGVREEDLDTNIEMVEKTLGALIYQGFHVATYVRNSEGRTPDEYPLTPEVFYYTLRDSSFKVDISRKTSSLIYGFLSSLGIFKRAHAYCAGEAACHCADGQPCSSSIMPNCDWDSSHNKCLEWTDCTWSDKLGQCIASSLDQGYCYTFYVDNCYWVNPDPGEDCALEGESCVSIDCCAGLTCESGICVSDGGGGSVDCDGCHCNWLCGAPKSCPADNQYCCTYKDSHYTPDSWCDQTNVYRCEPPEGCSSDSGGDDSISNWVVGRVFEKESSGDQTIYVRSKDCDECTSSWRRFDSDFRVYVEQSSGTPHESGWSCNDCPYYHIGKKPSMDGNWWNVVAELPPNVYCDIWTLTYPNPVVGDPMEHNDAVCTAFHSDGSCKTLRGEGCEAYVYVENSPWQNHLNFWVTRCPYDDLTCDNLRVTNTGGSEDITCVLEADGMVIDVYMNSPNAEEVWFPTWTEYDGTGDRVWYSATHQGGGLWKATIDLKNHPGMGKVTIHGYADNCSVDGRQPCGGGLVLNKIEDPQVADHLSETVTCSATTKEVDFRWYYNDSYGYIPPASIIRVDKIDDPNFYDCGCPFSWGCNWMTENDVFSWVDSGSSCYKPWSWSTWNQCNWGGYAGAAKCGVKSGCDCTFSGYQAGLLEGEYEWDVQSIDACTEDYRNPHDFKSEKESFTCYNEPPECGDIVGPDTVLFGDTVGFSSWVRDSMDPVEYWWESEVAGVDCNGVFSDPHGTAGASSIHNITTNYTAPSRRDFCWLWDPVYKHVPITLRVSDTEKETIKEKQILQQFPLITGTIYDATAGSCGDKSNPLPYFSTDPDLTIRGSVGGYGRSGYYDIDTSSGVYNISTDIDTSYIMNYGPFSVNSTLQSLYLQNDDIVLPLDTNLKTACVEGENPDGETISDLYPSDSPLGAFASYTMPRGYPAENYDKSQSTNIDIGYQIVSALDGWFTVLDGSVYSRGDVTMVTPQEPLAYDNNMTNDYAFSAGDLGINTRIGNETISKKGYAYNFSPSFFDIAVTDADFSTEADGLQRIDTLLSLSPNQIYIMDASSFQNSASGDYSSRISGSGVVVIYIEGDLTFEEDFYSTDPNKKILLITENKVTFSEGLGVDKPNGNGMDSSRIDVSIFTSGSIDFPGVDVDTTLDIVQPGDDTLVINGTLIAGGNINFNRDRTINDAGELRNMYPGVAVHYDPALGHYLQKQLMEDTDDFEKLFLNLINVSWDLEESN